MDSNVIEGVPDDAFGRTRKCLMCGRRWLTVECSPDRYQAQTSL